MENTILVVDDAEDSWLLISSILRAHHYQPIRAATCAEALSEARTHRPRLILLDLGLPDGDGFVVLERLKGNKTLSAIPVIVVTVRDPELAEDKAREYGAVAYLQKPVKAEQLITMIREALGTSRSTSA